MAHATGISAGRKYVLDIRELGPDDSQAYRHLRIEASADPAFASSPAVEAAISDELLKRVLDTSTNGEILGAFDGTRLLGMIGFGRNAETSSGTLFGLFVTPGHRNKGLGRALVRALIRHVTLSTTLSCLELLVDASNDVAIDLYRTEGFEMEEGVASALRMRRPV